MFRVCVIILPSVSPLDWKLPEDKDWLCPHRERPGPRTARAPGALCGVPGGDNRSRAALGGRRAEAKATPPSPRLPPQPRDLRRRALALGRRGAASEAKATLRQEVFGLIFIGGAAGEREEVRDHRLKGRRGPKQENRNRGQPLPLPPRALRAPPPPWRPRATPTRRATRLGVPAGAAPPRPPLARG